MLKLIKFQKWEFLPVENSMANFVCHSGICWLGHPYYKLVQLQSWRSVEEKSSCERMWTLSSSEYLRSEGIKTKTKKYNKGFFRACIATVLLFFPSFYVSKNESSDGLVRPLDSHLSLQFCFHRWPPLGRKYIKYKGFVHANKFIQRTLSDVSLQHVRCKWEFPKPSISNSPGKLLVTSSCCCGSATKLGFHVIYELDMFQIFHCWHSVDTIHHFALKSWSCDPLWGHRLQTSIEADL